MRINKQRPDPFSVRPGSSPISPSFDADGNQTTTGLGQVYIWDAENRLIGVEPIVPLSGDKKVVNTYDYQSRRVRRAVFTYVSGSWSLSTDEKFIYDGWNVVAVLNSSSGNALLRAYTWGNDLSGSMLGASGVGGLLAVKDGAAVYHYTYDANGNVSEVLNNTGSVAAHYEYSPFGGVVVASGVYASVNEYRFGTKSWDAVSGLCYFGYRYYSPVTGRWLSRDPIAEIGGVNIYSYCINRPIALVDSDGRLWSWGAVGVGAVAGALYNGMASVVSQGIAGNGINWGTVGWEAAQGAIAGAALGAVGGALSGDPTALVAAGSIMGGIVGGTIDGLLDAPSNPFNPPPEDLGPVSPVYPVSPPVNPNVYYPPPVPVVPCE
jgi:RHS repeat-associated protein